MNYLLSTTEMQDAPYPKLYAANLYTNVEKMPHLLSGGGVKELIEKIQSNVKYPEISINNKIEGKVFINFIITPEGDIVSAKVVKGVEINLDEAVIVALKKIPKLAPGEQAGKKVYVTLNLPILLQLPER